MYRSGAKSRRKLQIGVARSPRKLSLLRLNLRPSLFVEDVGAVDSKGVGAAVVVAAAVAVGVVGLARK